MVEYDIDSYNRKWRQTYGIFRYKDGTLGQGMYQEFFPIVKNVIGAGISCGNIVHKYAMEAEVDGYESVSIVYHPIESGWYAHRDGFALLTRRHVRGFQIGVSTSNHYLTVMSKDGTLYPEARYGHVNYLKRPDYTLYDFSKFGIMNERLWWKGDQLFYLNRTIGFFTKPDHIKVENRAYIPYITPHLGDQCQISC